MFSVGYQLPIADTESCCRRINFHYRDRSVGMSAEISHYRYRFSL